MSKKRSEALHKLLLSYSALHEFRNSVSSGQTILTNTGSSEGDLSKMLGFIKSSHYIRFIRVNFIDQPIKGNNMSLKAIDEMVRNIQLFIESSGAHYLQPITEIVALHPYTLFEGISERISSTFEEIFTTRRIAPAPILEQRIEESIQHRNGDGLWNAIVNYLEHNHASENHEPARFYAEHSIRNCHEYFNHNEAPEQTSHIAPYSASSLSDFHY